MTNSKSIDTTFGALNAVHTQLVEIEIYLKDRKPEFINLPYSSGEHSYASILGSANKAKQAAENANKHYLTLSQDFTNIKGFTDSLGDSSKEIRNFIEKESFTKAIDIKHKLALTLIRTIQIPIFIVVTYLSVKMAVYFVDEKDLIIPRGIRRQLTCPVV
ncbi:MAG: hypothetical protein RPS47_14075 [Colwellia sp.]